MSNQKSKFFIYKFAFLDYMNALYGDTAELFYENPNILGFPNSERYTDQFLQDCKKKMTVKLGRRIVCKYKQSFLDFLQLNFGNEKYLDYIENRNCHVINLNYPDDGRYSEDYCRYRFVNNCNVKKSRQKKFDMKTAYFDEIVRILNDLLSSGKDKIVENKVCVFFYFYFFYNILFFLKKK